MYVITDELLDAMKAAAADTWNYFEAQFAGMTREQAEYVRSLRVDSDDYSWRGVAAACAEAWDGDWESNQIAGMVICKRAAEMFGENYNVEPWN